MIKDTDVVITGGGNSAGQAVVYLAQFARKVTHLVRGDSLKKSMSDYLIKDIQRLENVDLKLNCEAIEGRGNTRLEEIDIRDRTTGKIETLSISAFFVMIGALPHTDWLSSNLHRDKHGFIITGQQLEQNSEHQPLRFETSMPGVFAAGDVRHDSVKRVASAVGEGSIAVEFIHEYLENPVTV